LPHLFSHALVAGTGPGREEVVVVRREAQD